MPRSISIPPGQGDPADVVFLSYEAMFCCLRALVYAKGYREFGLRCLLLACENLYVRTGQLDAELLRKFELAQRLKLSPAEAVEILLGVRQPHPRIAGAIVPLRRSGATSRLATQLVTLPWPRAPAGG